MNENEVKHFWLYVLELENRKYYIGVTSKTPEARFKQHQTGFAGAAWTKLHKPLRISDRKDLGMTTYTKAQEYENKVLRKYILKYGIDRVRGADISLTDNLTILFGRIMVTETLKVAAWLMLTSTVMLYFGISSLLK